MAKTNTKDIFSTLGFDRTSVISFTLLLLLSVGEFGTQFFLKKSADMSGGAGIVASLSGGRGLFMLIGVLLYGVIGFLYWVSLHYKSFGVIGMLWHVIMLVFTFLISAFYFKESYGMREIVGVAFGFVSMGLLLGGEGGGAHHH